MLLLLTLKKAVKSVVKTSNKPVMFGENWNKTRTTISIDDFKLTLQNLFKSYTNKNGKNSLLLRNLGQDDQRRA
jgi:hypothetical protein